MYSVLRTGVFCLVLISTVIPFFAYAQYQLFGLPGVERTVLLSFTPAHPSPGDTVHLKITSPVMDLSSATIAWYLDGKAIASDVGLVETDVTAAKLGEEMQIEVSVSNENVSAVSNATIIPTEVDLLYDSAVYTPPFYAGRALPAMGARVSFHALARFKRADGTFIPEKDITYTWMKDGVRIPRSSGKGLDALTIAGPIANSAINISVKAVADGGYEGGATAKIASSKPFLMLYEDSPLYGYLYNRAIEAKSFSSQEEMTIAAVPFYVIASGPSDPVLSFEWKVNDTVVEATSTVKNEITLGAKEGGLAKIGVEVSSDADIFFTLANKWQIFFSPSTISKPQPGTNLLPVTR